MSITIPLLHLKPFNLNREELSIASHHLDNIYEMADEIYEDSTINKVFNNNYFSYIFMTIIKFIILFALYRIYKRYKIKILKLPNVFRKFNCCKKDIDNEIQLSTIQEPPDETLHLRRSSRLSSKIR